MRILIVDDLSDSRKVLRYMVENEGHEAIEAENGLDALRIAKSSPPDLIISDALMPVMDGFKFLRAIKRDPELCTISFVFYSSAYKEDQDVRLAMSLGANAYCFKPMEPVELWEEIKEIREKAKQNGQHPTELIEEDAEYLRRYSEVVAAKLEKKVLELEKALAERNRAQEELRKLNRELEQRVEERIVELGKRNTELNVEIHERRQAEEELRTAKAQLEESNRLLETLSVTDPLTGLANRRRFDEALAKEYARHARSGGELSMIMLDIDHFKAFNDRYGHVSGDACLQRLAKVIAKSATRPGDIAARYGGEEFSCILPETDLDGAIIIAEKIRVGIKDLAIPHDSSTTADCVTASLGVVTVTCDGARTLSDIIIMADTMLYKAKAGGRNQLVADASGSKLPAGKNKSLVQLVWKDIFCSGNRLIDSQHQELFHIANELLDAIESLCSNSVIAEIVARLLNNIAKHFYDEEVILKTVDYPGLRMHVEEHAKLYEKGLELAQAIQGDASHFGDIFMFLVYEVVFKHMYIKDREFFPYIGSASTRDQ